MGQDYKRNKKKCIMEAENGKIKIKLDKNKRFY